jgi:excisionase family DNA binding protein
MREQMEELEEFYTVPQIARLAQVSRRTVTSWIDSGHLPAYRYTSRGPWRVLKSDWEIFKKGGSNPERGIAYSNELAVVG